MYFLNNLFRLTSLPLFKTCLINNRVLKLKKYCGRILYLVNSSFILRSKSSIGIYGKECVEKVYF